MGSGYYGRRKEAYANLMSNIKIYLKVYTMPLLTCINSWATEVWSITPLLVAFLEFS